MIQSLIQTISRDTYTMLSIHETSVLQSFFCIFEGVSQLQQAGGCRSRGAKRGKVEVGAKEGEGGTWDLEAAGQRGKEGEGRGGLWYKSKPCPEAHQACLIAPQVSITNPRIRGWTCNFSLSRLEFFSISLFPDSLFRFSTENLWMPYSINLLY